METFSLEKRGSGKRQKWETPSYSGSFLSLCFSGPLTANHQKGLQWPQSGQVRDSGLLCGQWEVKYPDSLEGGGPQGSTAKQGGGWGRECSLQLWKRGAEPICFYMFSAPLLPEQLSLRVRFYLTKGFHGKKKPFNNVNNPILIRIIANTDRSALYADTVLESIFIVLTFFIYLKNPMR